MKVDIDEQALHRRKLELLDQRAEAELGREQAHGGLKVLLNLVEEDPTRIWPAADLKATVEPIDVHAAVAEGLAARVELIILRCLVESLTVQTLPGARAALAQRDSSLGTSSLDMRKLHLLLAGTRGASELPGRRAQLSQLLAERERTIAEEIRTNVALVGTRLKQVAVAKEILDGRREHLAELERKREVGTATPFDIAAEKLEITKAEAEVMRKIVAWRIAQVKLRQSQGILAGECGYHHSPCCRSCGRTCGRRNCNTCGPQSMYTSQSPTLAKALAHPTTSGPRIVKLDSGKQPAVSSQTPSVLTARQAEQAVPRPTIKRLK